MIDVATRKRMRKLVPLLSVVSLAFAIGMANAAPYHLAARHLVIDRSPAAEVIKTDANQQLMEAARDQPTLAPMAFDGIANPEVVTPRVRYRLWLS